MDSKFSEIINLLDALNILHRDNSSDLRFIYEDFGNILTVYGYITEDIIDLYSILHTKIRNFIVFLDSNPSLHIVFHTLN